MVGATAASCASTPASAARASFRAGLPSLTPTSRACRLRNEAPCTSPARCRHLHGLEDRTMKHQVVSREEWLAARKALLAKEKAFTRQRDELSAERRELPWVKVEKTY